MTPQELYKISEFQDAVNKQKASEQALEFRKKVDAEMLETAQQGKFSVWFKAPDDSYIAAELIKILNNEGFKAYFITELQDFIEVSWKDKANGIHDLTYAKLEPCPLGNQEEPLVKPIDTINVLKLYNEALNQLKTF